MRDVEHWNGRITSKDHGSQGCCHCRSVCDSRDKDGNCTSSHEECAHPHDYWWSLSVSTGDSISVDSCEPWESNVPKAWTNAIIGEPAAVAHHFQNYLKADPYSLVNKVADPAMLETVPPFPAIHDLYKVSKVVSAGIVLPPEWNRELLEINADLGASNQVDVTMIVTDKTDPIWADALEAKWLYGPKNSVNIVIGVKDGKFNWVRVVTLSRVEDLKIALRDGLQGLRTDEWEKGLGVIRNAISTKFVRTPMAEWEYLASAATPPTWVLVLLYVMAIGLSCGLIWWAHEQDIFGDKWKQRFKRRN
jgi:hypothetical protein